MKEQLSGGDIIRRVHFKKDPKRPRLVSLRDDIPGCRDALLTMPLNGLVLGENDVLVADVVIRDVLRLKHQRGVLRHITDPVRCVRVRLYEFIDVMSTEVAQA